jgi:hypothetical protein
MTGRLTPDPRGDLRACWRRWCGDASLEAGLAGPGYPRAWGGQFAGPGRGGVMASGAARGALPCSAYARNEMARSVGMLLWTQVERIREL